MLLNMHEIQATVRYNYADLCKEIETIERLLDYHIFNFQCECPFYTSDEFWKALQKDVRYEFLLGILTTMLGWANKWNFEKGEEYFKEKAIRSYNAFLQGKYIWFTNDELKTMNNLIKFACGDQTYTPDELASELRDNTLINKVGWSNK